VTNASLFLLPYLQEPILFKYRQIDNLMLIYMSDFRARFRIKVVHIKEQKIIYFLVNLQA